ncbi:MAG TPA: sugar phosphate isomerase/epimerase [Hyphomicrobiaceae bacterium]|nr:sugar phosphate isomerase/epimerase [Hyphomicrobiaceae bacterium]
MPMRISLCNEVIRELPIERQFEFARKVGYDGLEIAPFTLGDEPHRLSAAERAAVRTAATDAGTAVTGLHYLMLAPKGLSITSRDAGQRARTVDVMRALCDLAADLGAQVLVHGSPAQRQLEPGQEAEGRKHGAACFAAVADAAAKAGVTYCIEPLAPPEANYVNTVEEAAEIARAIAHPAVRTMIDCSAAGRAEAQAIPDLLKQWLPTGLIAHVHLNDPNRRGPGEGALAFGPILRALTEGGYRGMAAVEPFVYEPDGPACAARAIGYVRGLMEK